MRSHHMHHSTDSNSRVAPNVSHFAGIRYERNRRSTALPLGLCSLRYASSSDKEFEAMPTIPGVSASDVASETPTSDTTTTTSCAGCTYRLNANIKKHDKCHNLTLPF